MTALAWSALGLWLAWVCVHVAAMALVLPNVPCCNGFRIFVPEWVATVLTQDELRAVYLHEEGHMRARHAFKNLLLVCLLRYPSEERRMAQEFEADDHVAGHGLALSMASAITKLGFSARDNVRAKRLQLMGRRDAGDPHRAGGAAIRTGEAE